MASEVAQTAGAARKPSNLEAIRQTQEAIIKAAKFNKPKKVLLPK